MNRIDRIISESINRFILREVDEARRGSIYDMEGGSSSTKIFKKNGDVLQFGSDASGRTKKAIDAATNRTKRAYTKRPRPKNLVSACEMDELSKSQKAKYISRFLRNEWSSKQLKDIITFNKRSGTDFGKTDRENLDNSVRRKISTNDTPNPASPIKQETVNPFQKVCESYYKLDAMTTSVENWGAEGDYNGIHTKLCEMPQELDNLSYWLGKLYDWVKNSMKTFQASTNRKGNIVNGYVRSNGSQAINGLDQLFPNNPRKFNKEITSKIINCAEIIRRYFGDIYGNGKNDERQIEMGNGNELGITTKRR
jgi:hypothetical protein